MHIYCLVAQLVNLEYFVDFFFLDVKFRSLLSLFLIINWRQYNEKLVCRGEIFISKDVVNNWDKELAVMNKSKPGRRYHHPDSFILITGFLCYYFGLPYRQTEGLLRTYSNVLPRIPDYTSIQKRVNKLKISGKIPKKKKKKKKKGVVVAIDSTGIKVTNRGDWMSKKWGQRKGFLKIHVGANVDTKEIMAVEITDEHVHDTKPFKKIMRVQKHGKIKKLLGDDAYDSRVNFLYLAEWYCSRNQGSS